MSSRSRHSCGGRGSVGVWRAQLDSTVADTAYVAALVALVVATVVKDDVVGSNDLVVVPRRRSQPPRRGRQVILVDGNPSARALTRLSDKRHYDK